MIFLCDFEKQLLGITPYRRLHFRDYREAFYRFSSREENDLL